MELTSLKFISEKREKEFNKMGIFFTQDLVKYYPRAYLDFTKRNSISDVYHNDMALVDCEVTSFSTVNYVSRFKPVKAYCLQHGFPFTSIWFNQPYVADKLKKGNYLFYGRVQNKYGSFTIVNPSFEPLDKNFRLKDVMPVYSVKGNISQKIIRESIQQALKKENIDSIIPSALVYKYGLKSLAQAYYQIHSPKSLEEIDSASERIALEEYFALISAFKIIKGGKEEVRLHKYTVTAEEVKEFSSRFGFDLTTGQKQAVNDIFENIHSPVRMNRLLQGDVGSGKTAVALCGIFMAVKSGYRAAYLSPTEVLAKQNYLLLKKMFPEYQIGYLSGAMTIKEKKEIKKELAEGKIDIICGTHAILQKDVEMQSLAFCVCDEQHRFGVAQRSSLSEKGESVDMLIMSATPIPRTLSLIFYGDLDVTTIMDKPKERQSISTALISAHKYDDMLEYIHQETKKGKQAYFVCSQINDEEGTVMSVTELYEELKNRLPDVRFALLHGKMKDKEKSQIMQDFKDKKYDCLVATTVIEVGIDVPNATIMTIYNAERFGLSQLHQLRGRVGRGNDKSYCFLLLGTNGETAVERLKTLKETSDGFKIAEKDLEMRGSGDFFGTRQSGKILNEIRNLQYPASVIFTAKKLSDEAFSGSFDTEQLRKVALQKYNSLKDVVLN